MKKVLVTIIILAFCFPLIGCDNGEVDDAVGLNEEFETESPDFTEADEPETPEAVQEPGRPDCLAGSLPDNEEGSIWNPKVISLNETYDAVIPEGAVSNKNFVVEVEPDKEYTVELTEYDLDYGDVEDFARNIKISASEELYAEEFIYETEIPEGEYSHTFTIQSSTGCLFINTSTYATLNGEVPFKVKVSP